MDNDPDLKLGELSFYLGTVFNIDPNDLIYKDASNEEILSPSERIVKMMILYPEKYKNLLLATNRSFNYSNEGEASTANNNTQQNTNNVSMVGNNNLGGSNMNLEDKMKNKYNDNYLEQSNSNDLKLSSNSPNLVNSINNIKMFRQQNQKENLRDDKNIHDIKPNKKQSGNEIYGQREYERGEDNFYMSNNNDMRDNQNYSTQRGSNKNLTPNKRNLFSMTQNVSNTPNPLGKQNSGGLNQTEQYRTINDENNMNSNLYDKRYNNYGDKKFKPPGYSSNPYMNNQKLSGIVQTDSSIIPGEMGKKAMDVEENKKNKDISGMNYGLPKPIEVRYKSEKRIYRQHDIPKTNSEQGNLLGSGFDNDDLKFKSTYPVNKGNYQRENPNYYNRNNYMDKPNNKNFMPQRRVFNEDLVEGEYEGYQKHI